jgi:hypothetical protein
MDLKKTKLLSAVVVLLAAMLACNLPGRSQTAPFAFSTPNLTTTALFAPVNPNLATDTPPAVTQAPGYIFPTLPAGATPLPSPQNTATVAISRLGPTVEASFLSTPPVIDGNWSEWTTTAYPATFVVFGNDKWKGPEDLEGSFRVGWDRDNLYLAVKVRDNQYVQEEQGKDIYKGDSVEILLDTDLAGDAASQQLSGDDYQLGISPGYQSVGNDPEAYLWFPALKEGRLSQVEVGAISGSGVYRLEAAIPWSVFGVTPSSGQQFGFVLSASDNDTPGSKQQEKMVSNDSHRSLNDPTTWGILTLTQ